jgi:hypothetical protein
METIFILFFLRTGIAYQFSKPNINALKEEVYWTPKESAIYDIELGKIPLQTSHPQTTIFEAWPQEVMKHDSQSTTRQ